MQKPDGQPSGLTGLGNVEGHLDIHFVGANAEVTGARIGHYFEAARPILTSQFQLPAPTRDWTGRREELSDSCKALVSPNSNGVVIAGMRGMGGAVQVVFPSL